MFAARGTRACLSSTMIRFLGSECGNENCPCIRSPIICHSLFLRPRGPSQHIYSLVFCEGQWHVTQWKLVTVARETFQVSLQGPCVLCLVGLPLMLLLSDLLGQVHRSWQLMRLNCSLGLGGLSIKRTNNKATTTKIHSKISQFQYLPLLFTYAMYLIFPHCWWIGLRRASKSCVCDFLGFW